MLAYLYNETGFNALFISTIMKVGLMLKSKLDNQNTLVENTVRLENEKLLHTLPTLITEKIPNL